MPKLGQSAIRWSSTADTNTERVHLLDAPLRDLRPAHSLSHWEAESLDKTVLETFSLGQGSHELIGQVRYDVDAQSLIDLINAGSQGVALTYIPNLNDPDHNFACDLISPRDPAALSLDAQRGVFGEQMVTLRLRLTDQGPFTPAYKGTDVLFWYRAGDSLEDGTFTRADTATVVNNTGGGGFGTLSTAASSAARLEWASSESSQGPRNIPTLLLEETRTNRVTESENMTVANWPTEVGTPVRSSAQTDPYGGTAAWLIRDDSTNVAERIIHDFTAVSTATIPTSLFVRQGTILPAGGSRVEIEDATAVSLKFSNTITWSSGIPTVSVVTGSTYAPPEQFRGGWWRISGIANGTTSTGNTMRFRIRPATISTEVGSIYVFGAQAEL